jgi:hypothetical protein
MSSETDQPRQRTVAELLAAHGDGNVSGGRRRRRRDADEPDEGAYDAPAAAEPDPRAAPPGEPRRSAPGDGYPPAQREPGGGRRPPGRAAEPRSTERAGDPWGADDHGADDWASEQWDAGPWGNEDQWDGGRRDAPNREAPPAPEPWDGPAREPRYADAEPREATPRRVRRAAEDRDAVREAPSWDPREPARQWDTAEEPRRSRERDVPGREPRGAEPEPNGRDPRRRDSRSRAPRSWDPLEPEVAPRPVGRPPDDRAPGGPIRDLPTDKMPQVRGAGSADLAATSRIKPPRRRPEPEADEFDDDAGPATMVGAAPAGAEAWHRARTEGRRRPPGPDDDLDPDDGPSTMVGVPPAGAEAWHRARTNGRRRPPGPDDDLDPDDGPSTMDGVPPAGAEAWHRARTEGRRRGDDGGPPTQAGAPLPFDDEDDDDAPDYPAGLGGRDIGEEPTGIFAAGDAPEAPAKGRPGKKEAKEQAAGGQAWAAVIAQWIAGAIGGAALWVGFRFLWRDLPVVAVAAAVLVTVGLVVVVRALLRSSDLRTTLFAVLVGLLLTVSPAILVLLGR